MATEAPAAAAAAQLAVILGKLKAADVHPLGPPPATSSTRPPSDSGTSPPKPAPPDQGTIGTTSLSVPIRTTTSSATTAGSDIEVPDSPMASRPVALGGAYTPRSSLAGPVLSNMSAWTDRNIPEFDDHPAAPNPTPRTADEVFATLRSRVGAGPPSLITTPVRSTTPTAPNSPGLLEDSLLARGGGALTPLPGRRSILHRGIVLRGIPNRFENQCMQFANLHRIAELEFRAAATPLVTRSRMFVREDDVSVHDSRTEQGRKLLLFSDVVVLTCGTTGSAQTATEEMNTGITKDCTDTIDLEETTFIFPLDEVTIALDDTSSTVTDHFEQSVIVLQHSSIPLLRLAFSDHGGAQSFMSSFYMTLEDFSNAQAKRTAPLNSTEGTSTPYSTRSPSFDIAPQSFVSVSAAASAAAAARRRPSISSLATTDSVPRGILSPVADTPVHPNFNTVPASWFAPRSRTGSVQQQQYVFGLRPRPSRSRRNRASTIGSMVAASSTAGSGPTSPVDFLPSPAASVVSSGGDPAVVYVDGEPWASVWIPDEEADTCMACKRTKFNFLFRKHHCRRCGRVICGSCSRFHFLNLSTDGVTATLVKEKGPDTTSVRMCTDCVQSSA
ncbi:FYVE zinc finger-domain-containing protein [Cladochytrium replicatum]|nr:FYVE zinc finger-domain-containing protein [Cladochytrium replicatum]